MASCTAKQDPIEIGIQNYIDYVNIHRNEVKAFFNSEDSPLTPEARMTFKGVDYFPVELPHYFACLKDYFFDTFSPDDFLLQIPCMVPYYCFV